MASNEIYESLRASLKSVVTDMNNTSMSASTVISEEIQSLNESFANIKEKELLLSDKFSTLFEKELECYENLISISLAKYYARMAKIEFGKAVNYYSILKEIDPTTTNNFNTQLNETKAILSIIGSDPNLDLATRTDYENKLSAKKEFFINKFNSMKEKLGKSSFIYSRNFEENNALLPKITAEAGSSFAAYDLRSKKFRTIGTDVEARNGKNSSYINVDLEDNMKWSENGRERIENFKDYRYFRTFTGSFNIIDNNNNTYEISGAFKRDDSNNEKNKIVFVATGIEDFKYLSSTGDATETSPLGDSSSINAKFSIDTSDLSKCSNSLTAFKAELVLYNTSKLIDLSDNLDYFYQSTASDFLDEDSENGLLISLAILGGNVRNYDANITLGYVSRIENYQSKFLESVIEKINRRIIETSYILYSFIYLENERKTNDENYKDDYIVELITNFSNVMTILNENKNLTHTLVKEFETSGLMPSITLALDNLYSDGNILFRNFVSSIADIEKYIETYIVLFKFQDNYGERIEKSLEILKNIFDNIKQENTNKDDLLILDGKFYPLPMNFRFFETWKKSVVSTRNSKNVSENITYDGIFNLLKLYFTTEMGVSLLGIPLFSDEANEYKLLLNSAILSSCRKKLIAIDKISNQPIEGNIHSEEYLKSEYNLDIVEDFKNEKVSSTLKYIYGEIGKTIESINIVSLTDDINSLYQIVNCYKFLIFKACLKNKENINEFLSSTIRILSSPDRNLKMIIFGYAFLDLFRGLLEGIDSSELSISESILSSISSLVKNPGAFSEETIRKYMSTWAFLYRNTNYFINTESSYGKELFQNLVENYNTFEIVNGNLVISSTIEKTL